MQRSVTWKIFSRISLNCRQYKHYTKLHNVHGVLHSHHSMTLNCMMHTIPFEEEARFRMISRVACITASQPHAPCTVCTVLVPQTDYLFYILWGTDPSASNTRATHVDRISSQIFNSGYRFSHILLCHSYICYWTYYTNRIF